MLRYWILFIMSLTASASEHLIYIGTYTRTTGKGIYAVRLNGVTGALTTPELVATTPNPSFIALSPDKRHLYAVSERDTLAVPFSVDLATGKLIPDHVQESGGKAPCYLMVDGTGQTLVVAHYHEAIVASLPIHADGSLGAPVSIIPHHGKSVHPTRQEAAHVHSANIAPDSRHVIVCDLGLDRVYTYALDAATATLTPGEVPFIATAPGAGPRHSAFSPDGQFVFVINELDSTMTSYRYNAANGALTPLDTKSTLPADWTGESTCAEVRVHPNGKFVYGSNRGHDSIVVYAFEAATGQLTPIDYTPSGGRNPRNFNLSPDGQWLVAANQNTDSLNVFRVDAATGKLTPTGHSASVPLPVCVQFAN
jgi:6-phosphogluconolactonase